MSVKTILAVDDEEHILELISFNLEANGYKVIKSETGEAALEEINKQNIDLVLLDYMLPGIDGIEVLKKIRLSETHRNLPVIMLTAKSDEFSRVIGLEIGADDYISKPFSLNELMARIKAVLRRIERYFEVKTEEMEEKMIIGDLVINKTRHSVEIDNRTIELPLKEFELLYLLAKHKGRVYSRELLLEKIWGYDYTGETRTVDVHIRNLRKKIEKDDNNPEYIKTVRGVGYKFV